MKLAIIFTAVMICCSTGILAQDKPCNCTAKIDTPKTAACGTPITLTFDPSCERLTTASQNWLKNKQPYYLKITGINSTLYTIKASANNVFKNGTFTMPAGFPSPATSTPVINPATMKLPYKPSNPALRATVNPFDSYFQQRYQFDYELLAEINNEAKKLSDDIGKINNNTTSASTEACTVLQAIIKKFKDSLSSVKPDSVIEKSDFDPLKKKDICNPDTLKALIVVTLSDLLYRNKLINKGYPASDFQIDPEQLIILNRENDIIQSAAPFILAAPGFINSVLNASPEISTRTYIATDDYLQLTVTLMKPKAGPKQDTVSVSKFNFYRIKYWKVLDISSGFVYDNLASKTFYFKNSIPAAENNSGADISVSALLNSYWIFGSWFKAGPCTGIAVSLLDGKSKYLLGGSLVFGRNNELLLSGGYALGSLPSTSNLYKNADYTTTTTTIVTGTTPSNSTTTTTQPIGTTGAVNTYNKFQGGFFIGLSYSFLKL